MTNGSCLCGAVRFRFAATNGPFELCHCTRCRKVSGSAFFAGLRVRVTDFELLTGSDFIRSFEAPVRDHPPAYRLSFCSQCGSPVPNPQEKEDWVEVPAGLLDEDPGVRPDKHIFVEHRAPWNSIEDGLPQYTGAEIHQQRQAPRD